MDMSNQISNWAGGGATTTLGAAQLAYGLWNQKKNKRPEYQIPSEIQANLTQAQQQAMQGMPEEQRQQLINNIQRSQTFSLSNLGSRKAGLSGVAAVNQQAQDAYGNLASMDAQARMANQQQLYGMRQNLADYKDQAFQLNKLNPYYENVAQNQAMIGAGMQNVSQGLQSSNTGYDWSSGNRNSELDNSSSFVLNNNNKKKSGTYNNSGNLEYYNSYNPNDIYEPQKFPYGGLVDPNNNAQQNNYAVEDATWKGVGQMGAIGGVIGGVANLGNMIGRPVREKNEAFDENTGQLRNYKASTTIGGGLLNPLAALQTRASYKGGFGDIDGSKYKAHLQSKATQAFNLSQAQKQKEQEAATLNKYNAMLLESNPEKYGVMQPQAFPFGGINNGEKIIEIEKREVVKNPDNSIYIADAPIHEKGGEKVIAQNGSIIFSDRLKVPGTSITFAEKAKQLIGDVKKINELFYIQEKLKKQGGR